MGEFSFSVVLFSLSFFLSFVFLSVVIVLSREKKLSFSSAELSAAIFRLYCIQFIFSLAITFIVVVAVVVIVLSFPIFSLFLCQYLWINDFFHLLNEISK